MPINRADAVRAVRVQMQTIAAGSGDDRKRRLALKWLHEMRDNTQGDAYAQLCFRVARDIEQDDTRSSAEWMQELRECITNLCQLKQEMPVDADTGVDQTKVVNLMRRIARGAVTHIDISVRKQIRDQLEAIWEIKLPDAEDPRETARAELVAQLEGEELDAETLQRTLDMLGQTIDR